MFNLILMNTVLLNGESRRINASPLTMICYFTRILLHLRYAYFREFCAGIRQILA